MPRSLVCWEEGQTTGRGRECTPGASGPQLFCSFDRQGLLLNTYELCGMQEKYNDPFQGVATAFSCSSQSSGEKETSTEPEVYLRGTGSNYRQFVCGGALLCGVEELALARSFLGGGQGPVGRCDRVAVAPVGQGQGRHLALLTPPT